VLRTSTSPRKRGEAKKERLSLTVCIQREDFDIGAEIAQLTRGRTDVGAVATFTGICRADESSGRVAAMTLEHYPGMAEAEIERHVEEARERWPLLGVTVIHRVGRFAPGENIVLVIATSSHREAAFAAAEFLMDYLKTRAPFWKKEERAGGDNWVEARQSDDAAAQRWDGGRKEAAE
jgi:molybdopterin synthase catalytic subunit